MSNTIAKERAQVIYTVKETTAGTPVFPSAASQLVVATGPVNPDQQPPMTNSKELADTRDVLERFQGQIGSGTWDVPIYLSPSGAAGTPPMGKVLFESLYGT
jgi:hypothetical protein